MEFRKITEDMVWEEEQNSVISVLPDNIKYLVDCEIQNFTMGLLDDMVDCESPIEMLMSLALHKEEKGYRFRNLDIMDISKQANIICGDNKYRADFLIVAAIIEKKKMFNFVVEVDGHDFHQKTKKQVERDNTRNRNMALYGYNVIRFSGSEIYANSNKCASEVFTFIESYLQRGDK